MLKSALSVFPRYYVGFPLEGVGYISLDLLAQYGVNLHSSTPRIYGYIQYIMRNGLLPQATDAELEEDRNREDLETEVDVPQHISIGRVKSWQIGRERKRGKVILVKIRRCCLNWVKTISRAGKLQEPF